MHGERSKRSTDRARERDRDGAGEDDVSENDDDQVETKTNTVVGGYSVTLGDRQKCHCNRLLL